MKLFTALYMEVDATTRTSEKARALAHYFRAAPAIDAAWAVFVLSGRKIGRAVSSTRLREWAAEAAGYPGWLVDQCYSVVGDLSETLSLIVPSSADGDAAPPLHQVIRDYVRPLPHMTAPEQRKTIHAAWSLLNAEQRMVFHKLLGGNFRVGVSKLILMRALADVAGVAPAVIAHRLAGNWAPDEATMRRILSAYDPTAPADPGAPYPFMLAHALTDDPPSLGAVGEWLIEPKWDGIRAQLIRRAGKATLWSRGDEAVSGAFPEIIQAAGSIPDGTVYDGEIVAWNEDKDRPLPFTRLQRRLNRQTVELTFWPDVPVTFIAFDLLEAEGIDVRDRPLAERSTMLEARFNESGTQPNLRMSKPLEFEGWGGMTVFISTARENRVEGVMLKRRDSAYVPGRPTGLWWKLKVAPFTVDAVLIAAEPGHGKRAGLLTNYTFGVWSDGVLVPVAKAYSGLTDEEIAEVDRFARRHTVLRHGPVHAVQPLRVFEIGFEAIQNSPRHKSGIALRFPRILRARTDKTPADADQLETLRSLLHQAEALR